MKVKTSAQQLTKDDFRYGRLIFVDDIEKKVWKNGATRISSHIQQILDIIFLYRLSKVTDHYKELYEEEDTVLNMGVCGLAPLWEDILNPGDSIKSILIYNMDNNFIVNPFVDMGWNWSNIISDDLKEKLVYIENKEQLDGE